MTPSAITMSIVCIQYFIIGGMGFWLDKNGNDLGWIVMIAAIIVPFITQYTLWGYY